VNNISLNDFIHINSIDSNKPPAMTGVCVCVCVHSCGAAESKHT